MRTPRAPFLHVVIPTFRQWGERRGQERKGNLKYRKGQDPPPSGGQLWAPPPCRGPSPFLFSVSSVKFAFLSCLGVSWVFDLNVGTRAGPDVRTSFRAAQKDSQESVCRAAPGWHKAAFAHVLSCAEQEGRRAWQEGVAGRGLSPSWPGTYLLPVS